jgi:Spy/CpxP family protein refolding chaperone
MSETCNQCARLWKAYESAVKAHLQALEKYQQAMREENSAAVSRLDLVLSNAADKRKTTRQAAKKHEATHLVN